MIRYMSRAYLYYSIVSYHLILLEIRPIIFLMPIITCFCFLWYLINPVCWVSFFTKWQNNKLYKLIFPRNLLRYTQFHLIVDIQETLQHSTASTKNRRLVLILEWSFNRQAPAYQHTFATHVGRGYRWLHVMNCQFNEAYNRLICVFDIDIAISATAARRACWSAASRHTVALAVPRIYKSRRDYLCRTVLMRRSPLKCLLIASGRQSTMLVSTSDVVAASWHKYVVALTKH